MSNPYYGNGGASGGGGGGFLSQGGSQGTPGDRRSAQTHSLRPVNVAQIIAASTTQGHETEFSIDDVPVGLVTVVAQVILYTRQTTANVYKIQDGSGEIEARHWAEQQKGDDDEMDDDSENSKLRDRFVRFVGSIRVYQGKRHINAQLVRVIDDPMEAYFHFNEVMAVTLYHRHGPPGGGESRPAGNASLSSYQNQASSSNAADANLTPVQRAIVNYFRTNTFPADGAHVRKISAAIVNITKEQATIAEAIESLVEQGTIYSTSDDQHFLLAE